MDQLISWIRGDQPEEDEWPMCPDHDVPMELVKKVGKPARYADQENETYTMLFRCPVPGCNHTAERTRIRTQIPVPGENTERPSWAKDRRTSV